MNDQIMVSVLCLTYNHEPFIRKCLEGFVSQKTDFPYEVLIHDDASTDKTADIIREYEVKYPDIIKPIYQTENQHSKGVRITNTYNIPRAKGKYLAWCEGDDYWCDENKLQTQFDYMESHPDCTFCAHQALIKDLYSGNSRPLALFDKTCDFSFDEVMTSGVRFATNSFFVRKEIHVTMPKLFESKSFGDKQVVMYNTLQGYCHFIEDTMSVYNFGTPGSFNDNNYFNLKKRCAFLKEQIALNARVDAYTNGEHHEALQTDNDRSMYYYHLAHGDFIAVGRKKYKKYYDSENWSPVKEALANRINAIKSIFRKK